MNNDLDNLFKKVLQEESIEPPPHIWENINRHLGHRQRKIAAWWWRSAAAVALLAAFAGWWNLNNTPSLQVPVVLVEQQFKPLEFPVEKTVHTKLPPAESKKIEQATHIPIVQAGRKERKLLEISPVLMADNYEGIESAMPETHLKNVSIQKNFIPLTSRDALENYSDYQKLLIENPRPIETKKPVKFTLSGHFVPAYSSGSYSSSVKDVRGARYSENQMDGMMNAGGGLKLSVTTGKRLSLQTGIFYSRMGQETEQGAALPRSTSPLLFCNVEDAVATPLGNIKTKTQTMAFRSEEAIVFNSIAATEETLEQVFGTLEIPLLLHYQLNDNKLRFSLIGGFSGNFVVNNKVYLKNGNDKELLGSTEDIRNFNVSTDWGVGIEYLLGRKVKFMLEPGFRYFLQSLSQNAKIDYKPYLFTFSTGIGIEF